MSQIQDTTGSRENKAGRGPAFQLSTAVFKPPLDVVVWNKNCSFISHKFVGETSWQSSVVPNSSTHENQLADRLVLRVQDGSAHTSGALVGMPRRLGSVGTVDWSTNTWPRQHGGLK